MAAEFALGQTIDPSGQHVLKRCEAEPGKVVIWNAYTSRAYCSHRHTQGTLIQWLQGTKSPSSQQLCPDCEEVVASQTENIARLTVENTDYRRVIRDTPSMQLAVMSLGWGEEIGEEVHPHNSQFIRVEAGVASLTKDGITHLVPRDHFEIVGPGVRHNVWNITPAGGLLKLYTIYCPPVHAPGTVQRTKND